VGKDGAETACEGHFCPYWNSRFSVVFSRWSLTETSHGRFSALKASWLSINSGHDFCLGKNLALWDGMTVIGGHG
jgi:hypothetical protein